MIVRQTTDGRRFTYAVIVLLGLLSVALRIVGSPFTLVAIAAFVAALLATGILFADYAKPQQKVLAFPPSLELMAAIVAVDVWRVGVTSLIEGTTSPAEVAVHLSTIPLTYGLIQFGRRIMGPRFTL